MHHAKYVEGTSLIRSEEYVSGHLSPESIEEYFLAGVPTAFVLCKTPMVRLEIEPERELMRLVCPAFGGDPDVLAYERLSFERTHIVGEAGKWFRLEIDATRMHYEAYVLIESVVEHLGAGATFRHALSESLSSLKDLLASRERMTEEREAGVIGELLVLRHAIARLGEVNAMAAWLGPLSEEHDFRFQGFDAEVKTTRSEKRVHRIGSDTQLEPTEGRTLYLISIQITNAGTAAEGFSLAELIGHIRGNLDQTTGAFDEHLRNVGWREQDSDLYTVRFQERTAPRAFVVDHFFPAITATRLQGVIPQRPLVSDVSYKIDVSYLSSQLPPTPLDNYCEAIA